MDITKAENFMREALIEAEKAFALAEVPVGCVIVHDDKIIARAHNTQETSKDPTCHAEMNAIREASKVLGGWRLLDCKMFVTVEPCAMCAGAIVLSRIDELYIGTTDPKMGACGSVNNIVNDSRLNHQVKIEVGLLQNECSELMKSFFKKLRN